MDDFLKKHVGHEVIELVPAKDAAENGKRLYEHGTMSGAIIAVMATSKRPFTFRGIAADVGVGALVGFAAIGVGRVMDSLFGRKTQDEYGVHPQRHVHSDSCGCQHKQDWAARVTEIVHSDDGKNR